MSIWKKPIALDALNAASAGNAVGHLGIEFSEVGDDFIRARMPVDARTRQPFGLLHGGVSVSYTHLDVYKRQGWACPTLRRPCSTSTPCC